MLHKNIRTYGIKIMFWISLAAVCVFAAAGCGKENGRREEAVITFQMEPSTDGVEDFTELLGSIETGYEDDPCFNVTPREVTDRYGFQIFKFSTSGASYLLYEGRSYPLGAWFGGYGVTSFAVADLDKDGKEELYYTYSFGSGAHRSQVGYFDTADQKTVLFDFVNEGCDSVLKADENHVLGVYQADCDVKTLAEIQLSAGGQLASIIGDSGEIVLVDEREQEK